jgi:4-amino-4-deoxy-L-arabinose transferase-like glycosyltransferase
MPPLFPCLLAGVFRLFGLYTVRAAFAILTLNSLFSALTCLPIYFCLKWVAGERPALLACWLWAIYPFSIYFAAAQVWDYALTAFLFATCFCFAQRLHRYDGVLAWAAFGILYAITALSNPSILSILPALLVTTLLKVRGMGRRWLSRGLLSVIAFILVIAPWMIRNDRAMHAFSPIRDGFWLEFWAGNAGDSSTSNPAWAHPASNPAEMELFEKEGEVAYLAQKRSMALNFVQHHPIFFVTVSLRRAGRFWTGFWSFGSNYLRSEPLDAPDVFFCTGITVLMFRGLLRWWKSDPNSAFPYLILLVVFPIPYYLTHSSMDSGNLSSRRL